MEDTIRELPVEMQVGHSFVCFSVTLLFYQFFLLGSFLAVALDRGFNVIGRDINPKCVHGTISNLRHLHCDGKWQIDTCDSGAGNLSINGQVHCVVVS